MSAPVSPVARRVQSNGITIAVHDWDSNGRPLLIVHGNSFLGRLWDVTARALAPEFRPIAMDLRGHGDSDVPPEGYGRSDHAADILGVVATLGLTRPLVLAHSVGAISTLLAAGMRPGVLGAIVAIEPVIRPKVREEGWLPFGTHALSEQALRRRHQWPSRSAALENYRTKGPFAAWQPEVVGLYVEHGFRDRPDGTIELKCPGWVEAQGYEVTPSTDPWPLMPAVDSPVLLVRAGQSRLFTPTIADDLAAMLPAARLVTVPGRSHALPMEDPVLIADLARTFFAEPDPRER
ncbi:MAG: alpha/beta hydrolase [Dehalococcoidia bacterium]